MKRGIFGSKISAEDVLDASQDVLVLLRADGRRPLVLEELLVQLALLRLSREGCST